MSMNWKDVARAISEGSESGTMSFPESVQTLMAAGFDGYAIDFRRATRIYYRPDGKTLEVATPPVACPVSEHFNAALVKDAIGEAQAAAAGYTYKGFCEKVIHAGCAGYIVSLSGKRVLYHGRDGATHTEYFPRTRD